MSGINYPQNSNPFFTEDDDDCSFGARGGYSGGKSSRYGSEAPMSREQQLQQMKENSMNNTLESTQRAMASIYDSERMGIATAEELVHQGEQLDNIDTKLDKINQDTKVSQRHINNIKSIFGGIKNWWSGGDKKESKEEKEKPVPRSAQRLKDAIDEDRERNPHPAMRLRSEDGRDPYADDQDLDSKFLSGGSSSRGGASSSSSSYSSRDRGYGAEGVQTQRHVSGFEQYDAQLDQNLDTMSHGMQRLKGLALGLGGEIERQNEQLEGISGKAESANTTLQGQNKQMRRILEK